MTRVEDYAVKIAPVVVALAGPCWAYSVFPYFQNEQRLATLDAQIIEGHRFSPAVMDDVEQDLAAIEPNGLRSSALPEAVVFRLRRAEEAVRTSTKEAVEAKGNLLDQSILIDLSNVPTDAFGWLALFLRSTEEKRPAPERSLALRLSYEFGRNEGWIAVRRNRFVQSHYDELPRDLRAAAVNEFCGLTAGNFVRDAANIVTNEGWPRRDILLACVPDIPKEEILKDLSRKGLHISSQPEKLNARPWD